MSNGTNPGKRVERALEQLSVAVTRWTGSSWGFSCALLILIVWAACGPVFHYSNTWQLVINTATTIVTFLMVFLIQRSQNKDARAIQVKLDELVLALTGASNELVDAEDLPDEKLEALQRHFHALAQSSRTASDDRRSLRSKASQAVRRRSKRRGPPSRKR